MAKYTQALTQLRAENDLYRISKQTHYLWRECVCVHEPGLCLSGNWREQIVPFNHLLSTVLSLPCNRYIQRLPIVSVAVCCVSYVGREPNRKVSLSWKHWSVAIGLFMGIQLVARSSLVFFCSRLFNIHSAFENKKRGLRHCFVNKSGN